MTMTITEILVTEAERLEAKAQSLREQAAQVATDKTVHLEDLDEYIRTYAYDYSERELRDEMLDDQGNRAAFLFSFLEQDN